MRVFVKGTFKNVREFYSCLSIFESKCKKINCGFDFSNSDVSPDDFEVAAFDDVFLSSYKIQQICELTDVELIRIMNT